VKFRTFAWQSVPLVELCDISIGRTPAREEKRYWGQGHRWLSIADMSQGKDLVTTRETITDEAVQKCRCKPVKPGTLLMSFKLSIGKLGFARIPLFTNEAIAALPAKDSKRILPEFLYYALQVINPESGTDRAVMGRTLNTAKLEKLQIPLPPLAEQRRIAAILDKADAIRRKRKEAIRLAEEFLQSAFLDMFGDPVTNPKGWPVIKVIEACDCIVPGRDKPKSFSGSTPWVTTDDLVPKGLTLGSKKGLGLSDAEIEEVRARVIPKGSVIITCVGELGLTSLAGIDFVINQQLHAFQCTKKINNIYLMYALSFQTPFMFRVATSTTVPYLNKTNCNSIPVPLPPLNEQVKFKSLVESTWKACGTMNSSNAESERLFHSLVQRAFRGELTA